MRYSDERALSTAYKTGVRHRIWFLYGSESYLIQNWASRLLGGTKGASPFDLQRFDGSKPDFSALWDAVEAMPLIAAEKRILLDGIGALTADDLDMLKEIITDFPEDCLLIITAQPANFDSGAASGRKLISLIEKSPVGGAVRLEARSQNDLARFLRSFAEKQGCTLSAELSRHILGACGTDLLTLQNELLKICAYAGSGEITRAQIDAVLTPKLEARVFDLQRFITAGQARQALELLSSLRALRSSPVAIIGALSMSFCDLYRARAARNAGRSQADMATSLGYHGGSTFRAERAWTGCRDLDAASLRNAMELLFTCDYKLKSTGTDDWILLEQTVVSLMLACTEAR